MNVNFICVGAAAFRAVKYSAEKHQGIFVHLTDAVKNDEQQVLYPAGLYFGGTKGWEMLSNDTDVASIQKAIEDAINALDTDADVVTASVAADGVVTLTAGIAQEDGKIKKGASADIVLAKVATTGAAADVAAAAIVAADDTVALTSTTVAGQLSDLAKAVKSEEKARVAAIEALDTDEDVVTASVADGVVTLTAGIAQVGGVIANGSGDDITLAKVATTGAANDITFTAATADGDDAGSLIQAGANLQDVMEAVIESINDANADAVLGLYNSEGTLLDDSEGKSATVKADGTTYTLKQGTGSDAQVVAKFNIVKDSFVKSGEVVYGTLSEGTFTEAAAAKDGSNTYIKLVFATNDGSGNITDGTPIYIPAASLVEYSSVAAGDLYLASSEDHVISVTDKVKKAITKVEGLSVNGQKVADDGTVTIGAANIEYKAATDDAEAVSVKDALDNLGKDAYAGVVEDEDNKSEYVTISDIDENNQQTLSVTIGSFSVPEVKDEDGNTQTPAVAQVQGLATVEDVEKIITDNEKVTSAALNNLNDRVAALEAVDAVVTTVKESNSETNSVEVTVTDTDDEDSNDHAYTVSASLKWLTTLPA